MTSNRAQGVQGSVNAAAKAGPGEIVMGLNWDPPDKGSGAGPKDLDALCVLIDAHHRVLEVVHPGNPRNAGGSVIHTGDSRNGAGAWDDERIFVFLHALPEEVTAVAFVVVSATDHPFNTVRGASCHVTDHRTERECVRVDLTRLQGQTVCRVAHVIRNPSGWSISPDGRAVEEPLLADLVSVIKRGKQAKGGLRPGR